MRARTDPNPHAVHARTMQHMRAGAATGAVLMAATTTWIGSGGDDLPLARPTVPATPDGSVFVEWAGDDSAMWDDADPQDPTCSWWNGTVVYSSNVCSHFSLSRLAASTASRAVERAVRCAALHETECVLAPEIGMSLPAAFLYDVENGMRMVVAPRIVPPPTPPDTLDAADATDVRTIRVQDPSETSTGFLMKMNHSITVEFLPGGSRIPVSERFTAAEAYCIQLLRSAFVEDCWEALD